MKPGNVLVPWRKTAANHQDTKTQRTPPAAFAPSCLGVLVVGNNR